MSSRCIDYFALVRCNSTPSFTSEVQLRFPLSDHADCAFPKELHMFCFPTGDELFRRPETILRDFSFLLTEIDGRRVYVSVIRFPDDRTTGSACCLALTSHWPFYKQMLQFLRFIRSVLTTSRTFTASLESLLTNLIFEVPLPPRGRTEVIVPLISITNPPMELCFKRPPPNSGALIDYEFGALFYYFSLENIVTVFSAIFSERRIVLVSSHETCLTTLLEAFNCLIFPFLWRHAYIPLLPSSLVDYICAPMPFLMGICRAYLPDKAALNGVVLVDCDMNHVTFLDESGNEVTTAPVPALPDRAGKQLLKRLRNVTSLQETNLVCSPDVNIDSGSVKDCFLRFFAAIFLNFHSHFDDSKEQCFNQKAFLDSCSERCEFVNALLNSQMFASFLDERIQFSDDMDTLLFDEYIRREQGKPAAFLADTSQIHQSRFVCQPPVSAGNITYDFGFPPSWDSALIPAPRSTEVLVDMSTESQRATTAGMSYASLKFFMDQKTYSKKLHSMAQKCGREDQMFLSIVKSMGEWTTLQRSAVTTECKLRLNKMEPGDEFSIADVWNQICAYVETTQITKQAEMKTMNSLNEDLSEQIHFIDREIRILFDESKQLDAETTMRKTELERIKLLLVNARQKLALIEQESRLPADLRKSVSLFRQSDLSRLVAARSEVQALSIEQSEAETAFWTHLDLYNSRIPQIISELQRLNLCRVAALKSALKLLTSSRLEQLQQETAAVQQLSSSINSLNIDESLFRESFPASSMLPSPQPDADSLRTFTPSPVPAASLKLGATDSKSSPSSGARMSQSLVAMTRYSVLLWGQFDVVFEHAVHGKAIVKQLSIIVDSAAGLFEFVSRSLGKFPKSNAPSRTVSATGTLSLKLQNNSARYVVRHCAAENAIDDQLDALCYEGSQNTLQISRKLQQLFVEIRVLKRECKGSFTMIQRRRNKLQADIQAAYEVYQKNSVGGSPVLSNISSVSKSQRELDMHSRQWEAAQAQHQLGNAHLLDQFQRIEHLRLTSLKKIMTDLQSALSDYCSHFREMQERLLSTVEDVDIDAIVSACSAQFPYEQSNKELFDFVGDGVEHVSALITSMENLVSIAEKLSNKLRKVTWSIDCQEEMPSISKALSSVSTFFQSWPKSIDKDVMIRRDDIVELRRLRDQWQSKVSIAINKAQVEKKNRDAVVSAYEIARAELTQAMQTVNQNRERLAKAESESSQPDTGMRIMKFMKTPIDKQRVRLVESQAELDAAYANSNRLEQETKTAEQKYASAVSSLRSFMLEVEQARLNGLFTIVNKFIKHFIEGNDVVAEAVRSLGGVVREVDVQSDMTSWVDSVRSKKYIECPDVVLRNLERGVEDADLQVQDKSDGASTEPQSMKYLRPIAEHETVKSTTMSDAISGSSSPTPFYRIEDHTGQENSLSDQSDDESSRQQAHLACDSLDISDLAPPERTRHLKAGFISDASSVSTLSD